MLKKNLHDKIMVSYTFAANTYDIIIEIIYTALFHILVLKCFNTHYYPERPRITSIFDSTSAP